ncbi:putative 2-oxoglutarate-dependent dioxygenase ANS [Frankliniella fusca]|uniref:2-oxoglutarate-dependent dioxygenase ANS n=1 Tax=Frankliniella fusca TaxID=407009 RepID=A0AAE1LQF7_9NEOP|nr:putative 2-oxoglutarate-dependent dioxygenase ANS [Frankliniella fusca]
METLRSDDHFETLWNEMTEAQEKFELVPPSLPRNRRPPAHTEFNPSRVSQPHQFASPKNKLRKEYFEMFDLAVNEIRERFVQADFERLMRIERASFTNPNEWPNTDPDVENLLAKYGFDVQKLKNNLASLNDIDPGCTALNEVAVVVGSTVSRERIHILSWPHCLC